MPPSTGTQNISERYNAHLTSTTQPLPPGLAAVLALVEVLDDRPVGTISETLDLLKSLSEELKILQKSVASQKHYQSLLLTAGTDTFQRQLVTHFSQFDRYEHDDASSNMSARKSAIVSSGRLFAKRGLESRSLASGHGTRLIQKNTLLIVPTPSCEVVQGVLRRATKEPELDLEIIFLAPNKTTKYDGLVGELQEEGATVSVIPAQSLAYVIKSMSVRRNSPQRRPLVLAGASVITGFGGVLAPMGTCQAASVAKTLNVEFWVVSETVGKSVMWNPYEKSRGASIDWGKVLDSAKSEDQGAMDHTPPELITGIITEKGARSTDEISEDILKSWF